MRLLRTLRRFSGGSPGSAQSKLAINTKVMTGRVDPADAEFEFDSKTLLWPSESKSLQADSSVLVVTRPFSCWQVSQRFPTFSSLRGRGCHSIVGFQD